MQDDVTSSTYNLLTRVHTWPAFSNHTAGDGGSASNSLEAIHDEIHGYVGGQMGDPSVAGKRRVLTPARRGLSNLVFLQDSTLFSSCTTQTLTVCSLFGQLLTPECGSHVALPRAEPGQSPEMQTLTTAPVCHIALDLGFLSLRVSNTL